MFIDLENDSNPQYDAEEALNKEKIYKNLLLNETNLQISNSNFFKLTKNKLDYFDLMGNNDEKNNKFDSFVTEKLKNITNFIKIDLPELYAVNDLIV